MLGNIHGNIFKYIPFFALPEACNEYIILLNRSLMQPLKLRHLRLIAIIISRIVNHILYFFFFFNFFSFCINNKFKNQQK